MTTREVKSRHVQSTEMMMAFVPGARGERSEMTETEAAILQAWLVGPGCVPSAEGSCWRASATRVVRSARSSKQVSTTKNRLTKFCYICYCTCYSVYIQSV